MSVGLPVNPETEFELIAASILLTGGNCLDIVVFHDLCHGAFPTIRDWFTNRAYQKIVCF